MVNGGIRSLGQRAWRWLRQDMLGFAGAASRVMAPVPGLHTYGMERNGRSRRIHLRIEAGGAGSLFLDVTDVVHLNPSAARVVKNALDGVPLAVAQAQMVRGLGGETRTTAREQVRRLYEMVQAFRAHESGCPTCSVSHLTRSPLFSRRAVAPYKADLALTYGCNNVCSHCYNESSRLEMPSLSRRDWLRVIDRLHEVGVPHLIFTGGEATLHPHLLDLIHHADQLGLICGLNTNGRRFAQREYVDRAVAAGLNHVQITIGSHIASVHDAMMGASSFRQTVRGIENALEQRLHTITNTTLMRCNWECIEDTVRFLHRLGIRTFAVNAMIHSGGGRCHPQALSEEELAPVLLSVRDHAAELGMRFLWYTPTEYCRLSPVELEIGAKRCNAGEYSICIEPNGDVLPCQSYYVSAGNILRDPWDSIWHGELFHSFRHREDDPQAAGLPAKCWECPDLPLCGGGCRLQREAAHERGGGVHSPRQRVGVTSVARGDEIPLVAVEQGVGAR